MDWSEKISLFTPIKTGQVENFAPAGEMELAIKAYNSAINRIKAGSQDTALIALRKLAATYPEFGRPAFLLGCCLAKNSQVEEAGRWISQALKAGLPDELQEQALICSRYLQDLPQEGMESQAGPVTASSVILERVRRRGKVRLAGKKERRDVLRGRDSSERQVKVRTHFDPALFFQIGLVALAAVLLVSTMLLAIGYLRGRAKNKKTAGADEQLAWLVDQLEHLSSRDQAAADLIDQYEARFQPESTKTDPAETLQATEEPEPSPTPTAAPTATPKPTPTPAPTATPAPTPTPTPDPAVILLGQAAGIYETGAALVRSDEVAAAVELVRARELLAQIPQNTVAAEVDFSAGELQDLVEKEIDLIRKTAPGKLRLLADKEFNRGNYEEALAYYLPAYAIEPRTRNGGVAYYIGRSYQELGDFNSARPYYEYIINTFANRDIAKSAARRLRQLDG